MVDLQEILIFVFCNGWVAQLVEQWTENPCVGGSIPPHTTALKQVLCTVSHIITIIFAIKANGDRVADQYLPIQKRFAIRW